MYGDERPQIVMQSDLSPDPPQWHSYLSFPIIPLASDVVFVEVFDKDTYTRDDRIGTAHVPFHLLERKRGKTITTRLVMAKGVSSERRMASVTVRLVSKAPVRTGPMKKTIFLVRHGESLWNEAQERKNLTGMVKQYDHELVSE